MGALIEEKNFDCINENEKILYRNTTENQKYVDCNSYIGYARNAYINIVFLIISIIGLILNLLVIRDFIPKNNNLNSRKQSSMKKLFAVLPILDCISCIYWIISASVFWGVGKILNKKEICGALAIIYFLFFIFEFIFINFILVHFRKISLNPIEGILKPGKNIKKYFIISIIITLCIGGLTFVFKIIGRSPMNTCFINTEDTGLNALVFLIPSLSTLFVIFQVIYDLKCRELFINDKRVREAYKINSMYILVFSLLHLPMFLLILITAGIDDIIQNYSDLRDYAFFTSVLTCSIPTILGIIRNCRGCNKKNRFHHIKSQIARTFTTNKLPDEEQLKKNSSVLKSQLITEDQFDWLEKHSMEFFMRDILLSVAHCIYQAKSYGENIELNNLEKENESFIKHKINFENFKLEDETITQSQFLDVNIIDYSPKIFAYLRNLENINIDKMAESFLPKNNKKGISESQGKSGSFFISTDDNQYMIKTLKVDEFDLIRKTFLNKYVDYIKKNKDSLLCRIYGMYNIILSQGQEILVIVMRNVIGEFKESIMAKYDLKGSTKNRITEFDMEKLAEKTLKDLNFNEIEKGIFISKDNINIFRKLIYYDSKFLCEMELMDYSLFLVKLTLSKEQIEDLFGKNFQEIQEKEYNELMEGSNKEKQNSIIPNSLTFSYKGFNYNTIDIQERKISINEDGNKYYNSKYYKQYIYPSLVPGTAYILAIIDYFQIFNFYKYVESTLKTKFGKKDDKVSCVEPKEYASRFYFYFKKLTDIKDILNEGKNKDINDDLIILDNRIITEEDYDNEFSLITVSQGDNNKAEEINVEMKKI